MKSVLPAILMFLLAGSLRAVDLDVSRLPPPAARPVDFGKDIKPLFETHCLKCHGPDKQKSGLRLDQKAVALRGGENYAPDIRPGNSADSSLIHLVAGLLPDLRMPKEGEPLDPAQIGLLRAWIDQGAPWSEAKNGGQENHWSFQPITRPAVPRLPNSKWFQKSPIDAFVGVRL